MAPILHTVTLTGADDQTPIEDLFQLACDYPWLELGILWNPDKPAGRPRYPKARRDFLLKYPKTALHVCGDMAKSPSQFRTWFNFKSVGRIQLNANGERPFLVPVGDPPFILQTPDHPFQYFDFGSPIDSFLIDRSRGEGRLADSYPILPGWGEWGFAGGLRPENLEAELMKMAQSVRDREIWIDAESGIRDSSDNFDIGRAREFLEITRSWVVGRSRNHS